MRFLSFMEMALKLKDVKRTGWLLREVQEPESVAAHSFNVALLCMLFAGEEKLNVEKCIKLALVHDLHEALCGDLILKEHNSEYGLVLQAKIAAERKSAKKLFSLFPKKKKELLELSREFFERKTKEAIFVKDMDRLETCLQAFYYAKKRRSNVSLDDFFKKAEQEIKTKTGKALFAKVKSAYMKTKQ